MKKLSKLEIEYSAGYNSGHHHNPEDPLCVENIRKMETGVVAEEPMIKAYWKGYQAALTDRNLYPRA